MRSKFLASVVIALAVLLTPEYAAGRTKSWRHRCRARPMDTRTYPAFGSPAVTNLEPGKKPTRAWECPSNRISARAKQALMRKV